MKNIYIVLLLIVFFSCREDQNQNVESLESTESEVNIRIPSSLIDRGTIVLESIKEQDFQDYITTTGHIDVPPKNIASVSTFMEGYIANTSLLVGDQVKKGQKLVTLTHPSYVELQQDYLECSAKLNFLKEEYDRQKILLAENITSKRNYLKAESEYKSNLAHYNGMKQKLRMLNIDPASIEKGLISSTISLFAPISGFITEVNVNNGSYVDSSTEILEIVDTDHIHLELSVYEKDILNVKKGQEIQFKIPETSNNIYEAEVYLIGTSIDNVNRTINVHGHLINKENQVNFVKGMFVEAKIITNSTTVQVLPKESIVSDNGKQVVLVLLTKGDFYEFERVEVNLGFGNDQYVEIMNVQDLQGKQIVIKGANTLLNE